MVYGYSRCSTNETKQDIHRQVRELKAAGAEEIFMEYEHGDAKIKSQQQAMFAQVQPAFLFKGALSHMSFISIPYCLFFIGPYYFCFPLYKTVT